MSYLERVTAKTAFDGGDCYEKSIAALFFNKEFSSASPSEWYLVHGIAVITAGPHEGKEFGHAWLERGEEVYDAASGRRLHRELYYRVGRVGYTHKYTQEQARAEVLKRRTYGPWDPKISAALHSTPAKPSKKRKPRP